MVALAEGSALDLHEGISDPRTGCLRWPEGHYLLNIDTGQLVQGRCKATNLCPYCRRLAVIETAEMLTLDAMEYAPTLLLTLTAREHLTRRDTYDHLKQLRLSLRRRWPIEWFVQVEFQKRGALHLHLLVKGVPVDAADELLAGACRIWCRRVDARPAGQSVNEITGADGLVRYLQKELAHGLKQEQAPPLGWKGHRTSHTRGYFARGTATMREEARSSLRLDRAIWRAHNSGYEGEEAREVALADLASQDGTEWRLYRRRASSGLAPRPAVLVPAAEGS